MRIVSGVVLLSALTGCTLSAKPDFSASGLGKYSNPSTVVDLKKRRIEISSEANGTLNIVDASLNKDGTFHLQGNATFQSNPGTVVDAEGRRMPGEVLAGTQLQMMQMTIELDKGLTERHRLVGENVKAVGQMLALAVASGGEAFAKMIDATAPILAGSGANLAMEGLGKVEMNLGNPSPSLPRSPPEVPPPKP